MFCLPKKMIGFVFGALAVLVGSTTASQGETRLHEKFESGTLSSTKWFLRDIDLKNQAKFVSDNRCDRAAIEVTVTEATGGNNCETCQRVEARTGPNHRANVKEEEWYGFSFRVKGRSNPRPKHFVIGQWKQPYDGNPVIAQRYSSGKFHITVQNNGVRVLVAKEGKDSTLLVKLRSVLSKFDVETTESLDFLDRFSQLSQVARIKGEILSRAEESKTFIKDSRQLFQQFKTSAEKAVNTVLGDEDLELLRQIDVVDALHSYIGKSDLEIIATGNKLPDPSKGWVDMLYRFKPGNDKHNPEIGSQEPGEIEIWANKKPIVLVRGNLGNPIPDLKKGNQVYFKFGIYRAQDRRAFRFYFDEFKQGSSRKSAEVSCP